MDVTELAAKQKHIYSSFVQTLDDLTGAMNDKDKWKETDR